MADNGDIDLYADVDADFGTGVADTGARYVPFSRVFFPPFSNK